MAEIRVRVEILNVQQLAILLRRINALVTDNSSDPHKSASLYRPVPSPDCAPNIWASHRVNRAAKVIGNCA